MGFVVIFLVVAVLVVAPLLVAARLRMRQPYEQGIARRVGGSRSAARHAGVPAIVPLPDRLVRVPVRTVVPGVPAAVQENVMVTADAVAYVRVVDPITALITVRDDPTLVSQVAQTSLRAIIGEVDLDALLSDRTRINAELTWVIEVPTEDLWGLRIERVEVRDITLSDSRRQSTSRRARLPPTVPSARVRRR